MTLLGIPLKGFGAGKSRLSGVLDTDARYRLGRALADHTLSVATSAGVRVVVVTGDAEVAELAASRGAEVIEDPGGGLDRAAEAAATASEDAWVVLHADLPRLTVADLRTALDALVRGPVIAPSFDGGTPLIGGRGPMRFSYGPGSFHRHLAAMPSSTVIVRPGLALDLDTADDLRLLHRWGATSAANSSSPDVSQAVSGK